MVPQGILAAEEQGKIVSAVFASARIEKLSTRSQHIDCKDLLFLCSFADAIRAVGVEAKV